MKRRLLIAGNWKMNLTVTASVHLAEKLQNSLLEISEVDLLVCPATINVYPVAQVLDNGNISVGAQNMYFEKSGAFTGEISGEMVKSAGATHVLLGHSERRHVFGESNELIGKKVVSALEMGLCPVVCIGELLSERESGKTETILRTQLDGAFESVDTNGMKDIIIAYEPVWAIGTGVTATSDQAEQAHAFVREWVLNKFGSTISDQIQILYGGSVKPNNAFELLSCPNVDGALIGGASLKEDSFSAIVDEAIKVLNEK